MQDQTSQQVQAVTNQSFDHDVLESEIPVLVDFWAEWCGPCKAIAPAVESLATQYGGKLKVAKVNVDENPASATRFNVRSLPTLIMFKGGSVCEVLVGVQTRDRLNQLVERHLG
jgi:thioredoxin 1